MWWHCKCDCGNLCDIRSACLIRGDTRSCGCSKQSYGEEIIETILKENNIVYIHD